MSKKTFILCFFIPIVSFAFDWENSPNAGTPQDAQAVEQGATDYEEAPSYADEFANEPGQPSSERAVMAEFESGDKTTPTTVTPPKLKKHTLSVGYGILTYTDIIGLFIAALGDAFFDDDDAFGTLGALSIDYGYKLGDIFETGIVFNYSNPIRNVSLYTIMPRAKWNFNSESWVNIFMELDAGVIFNADGAVPIFHCTLLGLEFGRDMPLTLNLLGWGQRGLLFASIGLRF